MNLTQLKVWISGSAVEPLMKRLYGEAQIPAQRARYLSLLDGFVSRFPNHNDADLFSASGRIEVGGNHTDHQLGRVLAMAVDLDTVAVVAPNRDNVVRLVSKDYDIRPVDLSDLSLREDERYTTMALIRGLCAYFKEHHGQVGGFDAYVESNVLSGSGMSSSASIEVLIAKILDAYYGNGILSVSDYAILSQKAENAYFGKPCGLMDQMVIAHGGFCAIDFYDKNNPKVDKVDSQGLFDGLDICLVQCGGSHADLSPDYASIFEDCKALSAHFNEHYLSRVDPEAFMAALPELHREFDTRVLLRGFHFFTENARVRTLMSALDAGLLKTFLDTIIESGRSSHLYLQNVWNPHDTKQGLALALMMAENALKGEGAWRVHGGGFAGTILLFVPKDKTDRLEKDIRSVFGPQSFIRIRLREDGVLKLT